MFFFFLTTIWTSLETSEEALFISWPYYVTWHVYGYWDIHIFNSFLCLFHQHYFSIVWFGFYSFGRFLPALQGRWAWAKHWGSNNFSVRHKAGRLQIEMEKKWCISLLDMDEFKFIWVIQICLLKHTFSDVHSCNNLHKLDCKILCKLIFLFLSLQIFCEFDWELDELEVQN